MAAAAISGSGSGSGSDSDSEQHLASEHAVLWRSPGRAGFDIVPAMPFQLSIPLRTMSNRANRARLACESGQGRKASLALTAARRGWFAVRAAH